MPLLPTQAAGLMTEKEVLASLMQVMSVNQLAISEAMMGKEKAKTKSERGSVQAVRVIFALRAAQARLRIQREMQDSRKSLVWRSGRNGIAQRPRTKSSGRHPGLHCAPWHARTA